MITGHILNGPMTCNIIDIFCYFVVGGVVVVFAVIEAVVIVVIPVVVVVVGVLVTIVVTIYRILFLAGKHLMQENMSFPLFV